MNINSLKELDIPKKPGIYRFLDSSGILYIGKATSLRDRVRSYFGADVDELLSQNSSQVDYYFDLDGETCGCSISIEVFDEAMSFSVVKNDDVDMQEEGELELF